MGWGVALALTLRQLCGVTGRGDPPLPTGCSRGARAHPRRGAGGGGCWARAVWGATAVARGDAVQPRVQGASLSNAGSASQTKHPHPRRERTLNMSAGIFRSPGGLTNNFFAIVTVREGGRRTTGFGALFWFYFLYLIVSSE